MLHLVLMLLLPWANAATWVGQPPPPKAAADALAVLRTTESQAVARRLVDLLHDDDLVMPGFYAKYREIIEQDSEYVMVVGRAVIADEHLRCSPPSC